MREDPEWVFIGSQSERGNNTIMKNTEQQSFWWKEGFYDYPVEGGVEITAEHWQSLLKGQENGKEITTGEDGYPVLVDPPPPTERERIEQEIAEIKAYFAQTDYIHQKAADYGATAQEMYPEVVAERLSKRERLKELQAKG